MERGKTGEKPVEKGRGSRTEGIPEASSTKNTTGQTTVSTASYAHGCGAADAGADGGEAPARKKRGPDTRRRREKGTGGLQLERNGIYTLRCIINGKRVAKSTRTRDLEEARRFAKKFLAPYVKDDAERTFRNLKAAIAGERELARIEEEARPQMRLDEMWTRYETSPFRKELSETTLNHKRLVVGAYVEWMKELHPEVVEVRHVTRAHCEEYLASRRPDVAAGTYNGSLCILKEVFWFLRKEAMVTDYVWEDFPYRTDDTHVRRELTIEELARLFEVASRKGDQWRNLFAIGMYTGLRLGDCCRLSWGEVDIVKSIIQLIPRKTRKYAKGRPVTIPIHKVLSDLLCQIPLEDRTGYVMPTLGKTLEEGQNGRSWIQARIARIFKDAGIITSVKVEGRKNKAPDATFHSLRHTFVSMSANAGVPLHIVQTIVGHQSTTMTRHYYHENVEALVAAVEAIPSISETGDVSPGAVAPPDGRRMFKTVPTPPPAPLLAAAPEQEPAGEVIEVGESVEVVEPVAVPPPKPADRTDRPAFGTAPATAGVTRTRVVLGQEAALRARTSEAAEKAAKSLGTWGLGPTVSGAAAAQTDRVRRNEWCGLCVRRWCERKRVALLAGSSKLLANGGFRFLQEIWGSGERMSPEDATDALETFLAAKGL